MAEQPPNDLPPATIDHLGTFVLRSWSGDRWFELLTLEACTAKCLEVWNASLGLDHDDWIVIRPDGRYLYGSIMEEDDDPLRWIDEAERQASSMQINGVPPAVPPPLTRAREAAKPNGEAKP